MKGGTDKLLIVLRLKSIFTAPALTGNVRGEEVTFERPSFRLFSFKSIVCLTD
jgi:hypothetical protein